MQVLYLQLNGLVVLTGISIAIIQYLFTNHQANIISLLKKVDDISLNFIDGHKSDQALKDRWDNVINQCKEHSYSTDPNTLILNLFTLIIGISIIYALLYIVSLISVIEYPNIVYIVSIILFLIFVRLIQLLYLSKKVILEIINKEKKFKREFKSIQAEHSVIERIINNV